MLSKKFVINKYELYSLRENILDFYERNISYDFDFYGFGWNKVNLKNRYLNKLINSNIFLRKFFNKKYKNYKGNISGRKEQIIQKYKFCFCIENAKVTMGILQKKYSIVFLLAQYLYILVAIIYQTTSHQIAL